MSRVIDWDREIYDRHQKRNDTRGRFINEADRREYDRQCWESYDRQMLSFEDTLAEALDKALKHATSQSALQKQVEDLQAEVNRLQGIIAEQSAEIVEATAIIKANSAKVEDAFKS